MPLPSGKEMTPANFSPEALRHFIIVKGKVLPDRAGADPTSDCAGGKMACLHWRLH